MIPLVIIRPQPGCDASVAAARALGLDAHGFPLFEVRPVAWDVPDPARFDALLVGSANAVRHGGAALGAFAGMAVYAVGEKTAQACRDVGLKVVAVGEGGLQAVLARLDPAHKRLLRFSGAARVAIDPPPGVTVTERVVYSSEPVPMPAALADLLNAPAVIAVHSAEAARHLREQCERRGIDLSRLSLAVIGPRVAEAAGPGWDEVQSSPNPSEQALLALAGEMCKKADGPPSLGQSELGTGRTPMQDDGAAPATIAIPSTLPPRRRSMRGVIGLVLLAFLLGAAAAGWLAWRGYLDGLDVRGGNTALAERTAATAPVADDAMTEEQQLASVGTAEARLAMLEDRLSRLDLQANAASGNAARAEGLLIAFAARRMIDRGEPLRYLSDQLQLRFANAQPRAVRTIITFSRNPVTVDELAARLEALSPDLTGRSPDESFWDRAMFDVSNLFTVRREPSDVVGPEAQIERARVMLRAGRIDESIAQVRRLPGADAATKWIVDTQRYAEVQHALDLIETAAMLEPNRLQDSGGNRIEQPSPLATPTAAPDIGTPLL